VLSSSQPLSHEYPHEAKAYITTPEELGIEPVGIEAVKKIWDPKSKYINSNNSC